jgi:hypothetical protein
MANTQMLIAEALFCFQSEGGRVVERRDSRLMDASVESV